MSADPKPLAFDPDAFARRIAGDAETLEAKQRRRRELAIRDGQLSTSRRYTTDQRDQCLKLFGLEESDFVTQWVRVEELPPRQMTEELERAAAGTRAKPDTPLLKVLRHRLRPDRWGRLC